MEIANQHTGHLDAIFVPVGGGGLIAGIACFLEYLRPRTKIIGVEAEGHVSLKLRRAAEELSCQESLWTSLPMESWLK